MSEESHRRFMQYQIDELKAENEKLKTPCPHTPELDYLKEQIRVLRSHNEKLQEELRVNNSKM